jgi:site-specific DNA-methyltransferase (adenine-specific)
MFNGDKPQAPSNFNDSGSAARFFYVAKASKSERGEGNNHPTVKPLKLMCYLCRLVTPPGGTVLDCYVGSGTTGVAAQIEGFDFIGIDKDIDIATERLKRHRTQGVLPL